MFFISKKQKFLNQKQELSCDSIVFVYLLLNCFGVEWMVMVEVFISRKHCKTCENIVKSPKSMSAIFSIQGPGGLISGPGASYLTPLVYLSAKTAKGKKFLLLLVFSVLTVGRSPSLFRLSKRDSTWCIIIWKSCCERLGVEGRENMRFLEW